MDNCPLCGRSIEAGTLDHISCKQCGSYSISATDRLILQDSISDLKPALSCAARQASEAGANLNITMRNARVLAEDHEDTRVMENSERLLKVLAARVKRPAQPFEINTDHDFTFIDCFSKEEFEWYLKRLMEEGLIHLKNKQGAGASCFFIDLSMKGWIQAQPLPRPGGIPGRCFVAMSFSPEMTDAYLYGIKPAVEAATGGKHVRLDHKEHNNQITGEIISDIRDAQFVVADFTGGSGNVYYEAALLSV